MLKPPSKPSDAHSSVPFKTLKWKQTSLGTPIELHASNTLDALKSERPILLMGGVHGDEPEGVELATETLRWLLAQTNAGKTLCPWVAIPCLNVDGFAKRTRVNANGVDLNRNYPSSDWKLTQRTGDKTDRYYSGPSPASEIEIQGVVELIQTLRPRLLIHCHSWEPCIVGTGTTAKKDSERLGTSSHYKVVDDIGYPTPGSLSYYGWYDNKIPVICIEEQDGLNDLSLIWPRFINGMKEIFEDLSPRMGEP